MDGLLEQFARPSGRLGSQDCRPHGCKHRKDELMDTAAKSETYTFTSFAPAEVAESYIAKARELRPLMRADGRSEERSGGRECVRTSGCRWGAYVSKKNIQRK